MNQPPIPLTIRAVLNFPFRLCNPPPSAGNVRSCKVTPLIKISLDDILNKRHLPPLTLKDFEEWLVFVEGCPQYLYFLLWLKEYESRYSQWLSQSGCTPPNLPPPASELPSATTFIPPSPIDLSESYLNLIVPSASLALFFTRAKQTFLEPDAPYNLVNSSIPLSERETAVLSSLLASNAHPHPHPRTFLPLDCHARSVLKDRLERFAEGACQNVGTRRAWCGIAGGAFLVLFFGILPMLVAIFLSRSRWWRLVGLIGCWVGGTVVVTSFHGICMMIYVFGDLRQLRSFELARPAISSPRAIARARPRLHSLFTRSPDSSTGSATNSAHDLPPPKQAVEESTTSETSTGTPRAQLYPASDASSKSQNSTLEIVIGSANVATVPSLPPVRDGSGTGVESGTVREEGDEGGNILVSPAYYPEGMGPDEGNGVASRKSVLEKVFTWVRMVGGSSSGTRESHRRVESAWMETASYKGTFGVKSAVGRLSSGEKDFVAGAGETDTEVMTAEFIPRVQQDGNDEEILKKWVVQKERVETLVRFDFDRLPTLRLVQSRGPDVRSPIPALVAYVDVPEPTPPLPAKEVESLRGSYAFTHIPTSADASAAIPGPIVTPLSMATPTETPNSILTVAATPGSIVSATSNTTPAPAATPSPFTVPAPISVPPPSFTSKSSPMSSSFATATSSPTLNGFFPATPTLTPGLRPVPQTRLWWDTCPRHPDVEATIASQTTTQTTITPASPTSSKTLISDSSITTSILKNSGASLSVPTTWHKPVPRRHNPLTVPAFQVPLARVLSPLVSRGQWEIVVRSMIVALLCSWGTIAVFVVLPESKK